VRECANNKKRKSSAWRARASTHQLLCWPRGEINEEPFFNRPLGRIRIKECCAHHNGPFVVCKLLFDLASKNRPRGAAADIFLLKCKLDADFNAVHLAASAHAD
jgi:hypothetical protein